MSIFIENLTVYLEHTRIKQTYLSLKTGIDTSKMSRLMNGTQDITSMDMEKIAASLDRSVDYFLTEQTYEAETDEGYDTDALFYVGEAGKEQQEFAELLVDFIENMDEVIGAKGRYMMSIGE